MSVQDLLATLRDKNVELSVVDGNLRVQGNKSALADASLVERIRANKPALIAAIERGEYASEQRGEVAVPPNLIPEGCTQLTPAMLPLVSLSEDELARVVATVPGGAANIQDIYPLGPLQEGILFHHVMQPEGDVYLLRQLSRFASRERVADYLRALQAVIDRHDALRTSFVWEGLPEPVQVVWRHATLPIEDLLLDPTDGDIAEQLQARFHPKHYRLDVGQAPLWRVFVAHDPSDGRWVVLEVAQHLASDHTTAAVLHEEVEAHLLGLEAELPKPLPYRNFIAQARLGVSREAHEAFFTKMLRDVDEPTIPFGLADAQGDGTTLIEAHRELDDALAQRLRQAARSQGVSVASLCHLVWAMVLARVSGRDDVVFGTLLFGRLRAGEGAERVMGMFINTLPVRLRVGDEPARASLRAAHVLLSELIRHEHAPLALAQRCSGVRAPAPLFTAHLNYRYEHHAAPSAEAAARAAQAWQGIELQREEERTNYPLGLAVNDLSTGFSLDVQVDRTIDPERVFALVLTAMESLVGALERDDPTPLRALPVLSAAEQARLIVLGDGGAPMAAPQVPGGLYGLAVAQAQRTPDAIAVTDGRVRWSYRELVQRANAVAWQLCQHGVTAEHHVAVLADRSAEAIVGVLGILAAGGAYVPVDPSYPDERIAYLLNDAQVSALVTPSAWRERAQAVAAARDGLVKKTVVVADAAPMDALPPLSDVRGHHAAYVIYTSGSTGLPKGVVIEHASALNLVHAFNARHDFTGHRVLVIPPLVFDASVGDVFPALAVGATLVLHPSPTELDAAALQAFCAEQQVTAIDAPAALWRRWTEGFAAAPQLAPVLPTVTLLMFGGEGVPVDLARRFAALTDGRVALSNHYGPTEATVCATMLCTRDGTELNSIELPIGTPLAGVRAYVLDAQRELLPQGAEGELYIGGIGVARGYWGDAGRSSDRFVADPFADDPAARMYATGDLVRWNADGQLQFLGRRDHQVKIRGFRIELGEIEARLAEHPAVQEAIVLAREDAPGDKRLVAYVVAAEGAALDAAALRTHLAARLPEQMVPAAHVVLDRLPLTTNGKVDRKALPAPDAAAFARRDYEPPLGDTETTIARVWADVLKLDRVGRHDHFFDLGGHSLSAATQAARLRQALQVDVPLKALFAHPVLAEFAQAVAGSAAAATAIDRIEPAPRDAALPLSFAQQRLWFLAQMDGVSEAYHMPLALRLHGALNAKALRRALDALVARHEALRTTFERASEQPVQRIAPADVGFALTQHDLRAQRPDDAALERRMSDEAARPFDLQRGPLVRGQLLQLADDDHLLLITMHHIVSDAWSLGVMFNELSALYGAFAEGRGDAASSLPPLAVQYADYAAWQRRWLTGEVLQREQAHWQSVLQGAPALLALPTDRPRPAQQSFAGDEVELVFDAELAAGLKAVSQRHGVTLYMALLAAWAAVLSRLSGQHEVVIGSPTANRTRAETEPLIGFFINTLALRVPVDGRIAELLQQVKARALDAQQHQELPFEQVVDALKPPRALSHTPVFQVMFTWQNADEGALALPGVAVTPTGAPYGIAKFDLELELREQGERIVGRLGYATALFDRSTIERHAGYLRQVLRAMVADDQQAVADIGLLDAAQREQVLHGWNATPVVYPHEACIHELVEAQAQARPDDVALVFEDRTLTYGTLNRRANQLAHHLRSLGVGPDVPVAAVMERSLEMVVGLLAILKAGGTYVPLDPAYPAERLAYVLRDSRPAALLQFTPSRHAPALDTAGIPVLDLAADAARWADAPQHNLDRAALGLRSSHLAYIIYTSGSTGLPKGVMVEHANVTRLLSATEAWFHFGPDDVWTLFHSYAFDFSVWEIWGALAYGGRLVVVPQHVTRSPQDFYQLLCDEHVTVLNQTPSAFRQLVTAQGDSDAAHALRVVIFGGEALEVPTLKPWYARERNRATQLVNMYGITETTVHVTYRPLVPADTEQVGASPIGVRIPDLRIYILDAQRQPVPIGVEGELYVGGAGVARGYLNRPELNAERFLADPFCREPGARLYKTGDLGRWRADGSIEYLGRNDQQVKIRGFRIELGEIEARLQEHPQVREAAVIAREDQPGDKRLVAYVTARGEAAPEVDALRQHLAAHLPEHMVPAAYLVLDHLPLTTNGKLDRKALPAPDASAYRARAYEAPVGEVEATLAAIWADVLQRERVGRDDNFFELGGHSLLAITLLERMRRAGLQADVRTLFAASSLKALAASLASEEAAAPAVDVPPNLIPAGCTHITPAMLPLVALSQGEIDAIVATVPGGAANVQDIYPLSPLQAGMLFHHQVQAEGDVYLTVRCLRFDSRERVERYAHALQAVIDRHDILRTAFAWEGLAEPVQVVWRHATLQVDTVALDDGGEPALDQLQRRFDPRQHRLDLQQAPLRRLIAAEDRRAGGWVAIELVHHLIDDNASVQLLNDELEAQLLGEGHTLPPPLPFRQFVAQARQGVSEAEHEAFFRQMLGDVDEPSAPFGLADVQGDGSRLVEATLDLGAALTQRVRAAARAAGVSTASLCHLAWAMVLARTAGRDDVVFGTVLFGRMQGSEDAERALGMFINMLPLRVTLASRGVKQALRDTHERLSQLMRHEHAPLALAQRCSAVEAPAPLFSALLNYRRSPAVPSTAQAERSARAWQGIESVGGVGRTNYPMTLEVDDEPDRLLVSGLCDAAVDPLRVCALMQRALEALAQAVEQAPEQVISTLDVLPADERQRLAAFNATASPVPQPALIHQQFEAQVRRQPDATALVHKGGALSYAALNAAANRLARHLVSLGVGPDVRVAVCCDRGAELVIGQLAVLKAGGAYVPLDAAYPAERLGFMLADSAPRAVLTQQSVLPAIESLVQGDAALLVLDDAALLQQVTEQPSTDLDVPGLQPQHLAYVIYTSGSTGRPKGVMCHHEGVVSALPQYLSQFDVQADSRVLQFASASFDASVFELAIALCSGASLHLASRDALLPGVPLAQTLRERGITHALLSPSVLAALPADEALPALRTLIVGGEACAPSLAAAWGARVKLFNAYGPTETAIIATISAYEPADDGFPIGRPIANTQVHIVDAALRPVPVGVVGELCVGGIGVARGYLNQPALTAQRFIDDPFRAGGRLYRTGDLGRWRTDGRIEYLGRNDHQVKIRGLRIELGEIEARLAEHPQVRDAIVLAREDQPGDKRLVAYVTLDAAGSLDSAVLREHVAARLPAHMVPSAFVVLGELPLTANGKLDRRSLPAPGAQTTGDAGHEAPQGALETLLARHCCEVLHVDRIGRHDNFFALGGHSLLVAKLVGRLHREGVVFALSTVIRHPTVAGLAAALAETGQATDAAVCVREGRGTPLFLVHDGYGDELYFSALAQQLPTSWPVYGLPPVPAHQPVRDTVPALAERLVGLLRAVQPHGPYRLAGWSFGGVLAHEMAHQLRRAGEAVEFLALIDSICPTADSLPTRLQTPQEVLASLCGADDATAPGLPFDAVWARERERNRLPAHLSHLGAGEAQAQCARLAVHLHAAAHHRPASLDVPLHLFVARERDPSHPAVDASLGWQRCTRSTALHVHMVAGSHFSVMRPPHIQALGEAISRAAPAAKPTSRIESLLETQP